MSFGSAYAHRQRWPAFAERWDQAIESGYARLQWALIEAGRNSLADDEPEDDGSEPRVVQMTAMDALHLLHMHKHKVHGIGKPPGRKPRPASFEEVEDWFVKALGALNRKQELDAAREAAR